MNSREELLCTEQYDADRTSSLGNFQDLFYSHAVHHSAADGVNADTVAEYGARIGVPVKPMKDALDRASRMCRAQSSMKHVILEGVSDGK